MIQDKFIALTHKGEGTQIECKTCTEDISESLYESVCSFLNHTGGQVLVGVQDDGTIVGVDPIRTEMSPLMEKCHHLWAKMSPSARKCHHLRMIMFQN